MTCAGYLYLPGQQAGKVPCVVMGHGFSGTRNLGLTGYAEPSSPKVSGLLGLCRGTGDVLHWRGW